MSTCYVSQFIQLIKRNFLTLTYFQLYDVQKLPDYIRINNAEGTLCKKFMLLFMYNHALPTLAFSLYCSPLTDMLIIYSYSLLYALQSE